MESPDEAKHTNRLIHETSPYLLQHAHNPVDWYPWGEEALRRAKEEDKPILLSVGYSACHWCHVMERESFENEAIARIMNEHFISIKVDREERPDIDHLYMTAVQLMTQQGGWPMTVFLTPDGKPFYGGTYYPPEDRYGRPGFPRLLLAIQEAWTNRREEVEQQGATLVSHIRESSEAALQEGELSADMFDRAFQSLANSYDRRHGGFGAAPKFPQPMICDFLLRYAHRSGRDEPLHMALFTLKKMAMGGMYDQLGGGFHRYSTDERWLAPHFEKMLYDNAQLVQTYLRAWKLTGEPYFRGIVEETLDYVQREMTSPLGGFYSAQDADSEGEEGKFFVWSEEEIREVLGPDDAALFAWAYDVAPTGNWEGHTILHLEASAEEMAQLRGLDPGEFQARLQQMRGRLFARREQRVRPGRDEKVLTAWNGLMLSAFADAAASMGNQAYLDTAIRNADFVREHLYRDGRLLRTGTASGAGFRASSIPGFLEDYAYYGDGLLHLYEATFDLKWLNMARALADKLNELFGADDGGFYQTPIDGEKLIDRPRDLTDNATPSGNSVALDLLMRLHLMTGEPRYREIAAGILKRLAPMAAMHPQAFGRLLCAANFFVGPAKEVAVIGALDDPRTQALLGPVRQGYYPNLVVMSSPREDPTVPLLSDRQMLNGEPTAYLCENYACKSPTTQPDVLKSLLSERTGAGS